MEKAKQLAEQHSKKLPLLLLIGAGIAVLNTLCRADYNLILYLYILYIWKILKNVNKEKLVKEKIICFYLLVFSFVIDIVWCITWHCKWNNLEEDNESHTHGFVIFMSWIGVLLKIIITFMIGVLEWSIIKPSLPNYIKKLINSDYTAQVEDQNNF